MSDYDIITVDWKPSQTELWLKHVNHFCPTANVIVVKDTRPIAPYRCGSKAHIMNPREQNFKTNRIIYLDTDVLVFKDHLNLFDLYPDGLAIPWKMVGRGFLDLYRYKSDLLRAVRLIDAGVPEFHAYNGMMLAKNISDVLPDISDYTAKALDLFHKHGLYVDFPDVNEVALSFALQGFKDVYDIPAEIHCNLAKDGSCSRKQYRNKVGKSRSNVDINIHVPHNFHYHREKWLEEWRPVLDRMGLREKHSIF